MSDITLAWPRAYTPKKPIGFVSQPTVPPQLKQPLLHGNEGHLLTVAGTGAGKGVSCIIPTLLSYQGPMVVIDPKGENYQVTARYREQIGHQVLCIDPFNVTGTGSKDAISPYSLFTDDVQNDVETAHFLAGVCTRDLTSTRDPFWDERARQLLAGLMLYTAHESPPALKNLSEVHYLINQTTKELNFTIKDMRKAGDVYGSFASVIDSAEPKVAASIASTAQSLMGYLQGSKVSDSVWKTTFPLESIVRGDPVTIYLILPPDKLKSHGALLRIWLSVLISTLLKRRGQVSKPTLFMVDEAAQLGRLESLLTAVTLMRGYGVMLWTFWQDLGQLKRLYGDDWKTFYNNCSVHQFFGVHTGLMASEIAEVTGYTNTDRLLNLEPEQTWMCVRGKRPAVYRKVNYLKDKLFAKRFDPNPFYQPTVDHQPECCEQPSLATSL